MTTWKYTVGLHLDGTVEAAAKWSDLVTRTYAKEHWFMSDMLDGSTLNPDGSLPSDWNVTTVGNIAYMGLFGEPTYRPKAMHLWAKMVAGARKK